MSRHHTRYYYPCELAERLGRDTPLDSTASAGVVADWLIDSGYNPDDEVVSFLTQLHLSLTGGINAEI